MTSETANTDCSYIQQQQQQQPVRVQVSDSTVATGDSDVAD